MKRMMALLVFSMAIMSLCTCTKEDYRQYWKGVYHYNCEIHTCTGPHNEQNTFYTDGTLLVSKVIGRKDIFIALLPDSSQTWQCTMNKDHTLSLATPLPSYSHAQFAGRFVSPDSLYITFSDASPASSYQKSFSCKKVQD